MDKLLKSSMLLAAGVGLMACADPPQDCGQLPVDVSTGNAGCLVVDGERWLLVQQRLGEAWAIPGGTAQAGERAACTAARETREETGIEVRVTARLAVLDNGFHVYACVAPEGVPPLPRDVHEIRAAAWKSPAERQQLDWRFPAQPAQLQRLLQAGGDSSRSHQSATVLPRSVKDSP